MTMNPPPSPPLPPPLCSSGESRLFPKSYLIVFLNLQSFHLQQLENICNISSIEEISVILCTYLDSVQFQNVRPGLSQSRGGGGTKGEPADNKDWIRTFL